MQPALPRGCLRLPSRNRRTVRWQAGSLLPKRSASSNPSVFSCGCPLRRNSTFNHSATEAWLAEARRSQRVITQRRGDARAETQLCTSPPFSPSARDPASFAHNGLEVIAYPTPHEPNRKRDESTTTPAYAPCMALDAQRLDELERVADEQAALRRIATLVAAGATEEAIAAAVSSEVGGLFGAQSASVVRWDGDTIRVIGSWGPHTDVRPAGTVLTYGGDTLAARVVETAAPARIDSADELKTEFAQQRWAELGWQASIGAPIMVDRKVWGVVSASRTAVGDTFTLGDEDRLRDFSALVAQAIVNADARSE